MRLRAPRRHAVEWDFGSARKAGVEGAHLSSIRFGHGVGLTWTPGPCRPGRLVVRNRLLDTDLFPATNVAQFLKGLRAPCGPTFPQKSVSKKTEVPTGQILVPRGTGVACLCCCDAAGGRECQDYTKSHQPRRTFASGAPAAPFILVGPQGCLKLRTREIPWHRKRPIRVSIGEVAVLSLNGGGVKAWVDDQPRRKSASGMFGDFFLFSSRLSAGEHLDYG